MCYNVLMYKMSECDKRRKEVYKEGNLPYSFDYKIRLRYIGEKCPVCGCVMRTGMNQPTIQHNKPISKEGEHRLVNISVFCKRCNISIQDKEVPIKNTLDVIDKWYEIRNISSRQLIDRLWTLK